MALVQRHGCRPQAQHRRDACERRGSLRPQAGRAGRAGRAESGSFWALRSAVRPSVAEALGAGDAGEQLPGAGVQQGSRAAGRVSAGGCVWRCLALFVLSARLRAALMACGKTGKPGGRRPCMLSPSCAADIKSQDVACGCQVQCAPRHWNPQEGANSHAGRL